MNTTAPARTGYQLAAPTAAELRAALQKIFGEARTLALWTEALADNHFCSDPRDLAALERLAHWFSLRKDLACVAGHSMLIRIRSYKGLNRKD